MDKGRSKLVIFIGYVVGLPAFALWIHGLIYFSNVIAANLPSIAFLDLELGTKIIILLIGTFIAYIYLQKSWSGLIRRKHISLLDNSNTLFEFIQKILYSGDLILTIRTGLLVFVGWIPFYLIALVFTISAATAEIRVVDWAYNPSIAFVETFGNFTFLVTAGTSLLVHLIPALFLIKSRKLFCLFRDHMKTQKKRQNKSAHATARG